MRTPELAVCLSLAVACLAGCGSHNAAPGTADSGGGNADCGSDGHRSARGHCVYPTTSLQCTSGLRYESGPCVPAEFPSACGCADDPCAQVLCADGECVRSASADGMGCFLDVDVGGECRLGRCCAGCWDGTTCQPGTTVEACGIGGARCNSCVDRCGIATCDRGLCYSMPIVAPDCPHCGGAGELCCAGDSCEQALRCENVPVGEDYSLLLCVGVDAGIAVDAAAVDGG